MNVKIDEYERNGRLPWSTGYSSFKHRFLQEVLRDEALIEKFRCAQPLPENYAPRLDERVVEYPWTIARLRPQGFFMDAGSTFSTPLLINHPTIAGRRFVICTFETDWITLNSNISYLYDDLRSTILKDGIFESIVCISTIEHIGMGLDLKKYSAKNPWPHADLQGYLEAMREFRRLLKPGGQLLITAPFGKKENHGWLQQYDAQGIEEMKCAFGGEVASETYYRYEASGWKLAEAAECAALSYYNIHASDGFDSDYAAAARAVACLELIKPS